MSFSISLLARAASALLLGLAVAAVPLQAQSPVIIQTNAVVRVMAANLNGNTQSYQPFALRIFQGLRPDIVAIQEFNYANNTPADFRSMLDTAFGTDFVYFRENYTGSGDIPNGIISRYPIVASGSWADSEQSQPNRGFAWAQIALPGTNSLYVVSVHLLTSSAGVRATEAMNLKSLIQANFPANAWVVVAGDFNTDSRTETAMNTFGTLLSDSPVPTDAETGGNSNTSAPRSKPYDYVLPSFSFTNLLTNAVFTSHSFPKGLVFDSRVYTPLTDVGPVLAADSGDAQHMGVLKDFSVPYTFTNGVSDAPQITQQPQSQTVSPGSNVTFTVVAAGTAPLAYQWRFGNGEIAGATANSHSITNLASVDAGNYTVVVTNFAGSVTSTVAVLTVGAKPAIASQPQSQGADAGDSATFSVVATGDAPLAYQWRWNGGAIADATGSAYTLTNIQPAQAGAYSVVITNLLGSVTSANALLTVGAAPGGTSVIAQWNFNSNPADANTATGLSTPSTGTGTAGLVGGTSQTFAGGSTNDPAASGTDNSGWNTSTYPAQGTGNKTAGVQFHVSTGGKQDITIRWDQRCSSTGSKYVRLQYATQRTNFVDFPSATSVASTSFEPKTNSLAGFAGVNDNTNFAFRLVAEFENTAAGTANTNYVGATGSYGTAGTVRFDMVTVSGTPLQVATLLLGSAVWSNNQVQLSFTGAPGFSYAIQASTDLTNWLSLQTNVFPANAFADPDCGSYSHRFYRAVYLP